MAYFPMFIDLTNKKCLIVGGGAIALQKASVLLDFDADITVVAENIDDRLVMLSEIREKRINLISKSFDSSDIKDMSLVVAATDDKALNHNISKLCKKAGIPINAVDQREDCSFIFPSYIKEKELVAAVSSGGKSPLITQEIKGKIKDILSPQLGEINDGLGECREYVKGQVNDLDKRKIVFRRIYEESVQIEQMISRKRIQEIILDEL